jgi:hypothetical protein
MKAGEIIKSNIHSRKNALILSSLTHFSSLKSVHKCEIKAIKPWVTKVTSKAQASLVRLRTTPE